MRLTKFFLALACAASPLAAQKWDLRFEVPFPEGQSLPQTMIAGTGQTVRGDLDTGNGGIISVSHRLIRVGPILRIDWGGEIAQWAANGIVEEGAASQNSKLKQTGAGLGINAQLWLPFTGLCGEIGVIQRIQRYSYASGDAESKGTVGRTWLRVGARWRLPMVVARPYITATYQQPINKDQPVEIKSADDLAGYFKAQGKGQEFQRMWTFGLGVTF